MKRRRVKLIILLITLLILGSSSFMYLPPYLGSVMYPLDYRKEIKNSSTEFNVNPNFVAAVIYSESHFNARATSHAGARGLMQIMPATGAGIAKNLHDNTFTVDSLYEPARNIRYGTYYLKSQLDRYNGNEDLVLMHYNGGPGAVQSHQRGGPIPFETQGYVRKVKSAKAMYDQVYGEWWKAEDFKEFNKPQSENPLMPLNNVYEFWKILISSGG